MDATTCPVCGHQNLIDTNDVIDITTDRVEVAKTCDKCGAAYELQFALVEKRVEVMRTLESEQGPTKMPVTIVEKMTCEPGGQYD